VNTLGGPRVQGREADKARLLRDEALALQQAGCFSIVLELIPGALAAEISGVLDIPTIGIGAGAGCDGQVLVLPDMLGMNPRFSPRFLKRYAEVAEEARKGLKQYIEEVKGRSYPGPEHTFEAE
jgi:3-methyl-2-oxobutanoate hydroxymethyltransferase